MVHKGFKAFLLPLTGMHPQIFEYVLLLVLVCGWSQNQENTYLDWIYHKVFIKQITETQTQKMQHGKIPED